MDLKSKYLKLRDLMPIEVYEQETNKQILWNVFDPLAILSLDALWELFGPIEVNNWVVGGSNHYRGFRQDDCTIGAKWSQHKYGRAFDCTFKMGPSAEHARTRLKTLGIEARRVLGLQHIRRIENKVTWFHFDTWGKSDEIYFFNP